MLVTTISFDSGSGRMMQRSVTNSVGPFVRMPNSRRSRPVRPCPSVVRKSNCATKLLGFCGMTMKICPQPVEISDAPPLPGRRTLGCAYSPITVLFRFPNRSTCAPPRNPTLMRPPCSQ